MKKIAVILSAILLVTALAVPTFAAGFTPSVEQKGAPAVSTVTDTNGNEVVGIVRDADSGEVYGVPSGELIVTPVSAADSAEAAIADGLKAAYEQIQKAASLADIAPSIGDYLKEIGSDASVDDLVVRDLFDVTVKGTAAEYLATEGNTITVRFNVGISPSATLIVLHNYQGSDWEIISKDRVKQNADGTVDVTFDSLSPVAFVVDKQESTDTEKPGADEPSSPQTGDNGVLRAAGIAALGLGCAAVIGAVSASKKRKG